MNTQILFSDPLVHRIGWCLVHFLWQGLLVALGLAAMLGLLRRRSANTRYLVCIAALLLMSALPVLTFWVQPTSAVKAVAPAADAAPAQATTGVTAQAQHAWRALGVIAPGSLRERAAVLIDAFVLWLCAAWIVGVVALALQNLGAWFHVRRLVRRDTDALGGAWTACVDTLRQSLGIRGPVRLLQSARTAVPMAVGIMKPVILLPAAVLAGLTPAQVEAVLAHELAHIRRHDFLANLVQIAVETLLFYHPAVWWVSRHVREERENCCDDLAVRCCGSGMQYARALTSLAELVTVRPVLAVTATEGLLRRVQRIVGLPERRSFSVAPMLASLALVVVLLGTAIGCAHEDLTSKVARLNIDTATRADLIRAFGEPTEYAWNSDRHLDPNHLPPSYLASFPNGVSAYMNGDGIVELRFNENNYIFRGKLHVGSTLDEVLNTLGQPTQTVEGQPLGFYDKVLYKDFDGRKGYCYYAREDCAVRIWFCDYKVSALYVTRSDYTDSGRPPKVAGAPEVDLTPAADKLNIDTATMEDLVRAFGKPLKYTWNIRRLDPNKLPECYIAEFPQALDVVMCGKNIQELRFYEPNYLFRGTVRIGSTMDEMVAALGQPVQTVEGQKNEFKTGVLYRNIEGRKGFGYYAREDMAVRMFFGDNKVSALYVTRSDFSGSRK